MNFATTLFVPKGISDDAAIKLYREDIVPALKEAILTSYSILAWGGLILGGAIAISFIAILYTLYQLVKKLRESKIEQLEIKIKYLEGLLDYPHLEQTEHYHTQQDTPTPATRQVITVEDEYAEKIVKEVINTQNKIEK